MLSSGLFNYLSVAIPLCCLTLFAILQFLKTVKAAKLKALKSDLEQSAKRSLDELFLFIPVRKLWVLWSIVAGVISLLSWLLFSPLVMLVSLVIWGVAPVFIYRWLKERRLTRINQQLVDALLALANSLQAGGGFVAAIEQVCTEVRTPLQHELRLLVRQIRFGYGVEESLQSLTERVPTDAMFYASQVMILGYTRGGQQASFLRNLAENLQAQLHMAARLQSMTAQARMQGKIMALLPVFLFFVLQVVQPSNIDLLTGTAKGQLLLAIAGLLLVIGFLISRRILADSV